MCGRLVLCEQEREALGGPGLGSHTGQFCAPWLEISGDRHILCLEMSRFTAWLHLFLIPKTSVRSLQNASLFCFPPSSTADNVSEIQIDSGAPLWSHTPHFAFHIYAGE